MGVSRLAVLIWSRSMYRSAISSCLARDSWLKVPRLAWRARMMFSRTDRSPMMPSAFRSSGSRPMPRFMASMGWLILTSLPFTFRVPVWALSAP